MLDKDGSMLVRKLKRLARVTLFSSLNGNDGSFNIFCRVSFCVESSCWISSMSAFIASSDTAANVVLDTLVDSIFIVVETVVDVVVVDEDSNIEVVEVSVDVEDERVEVSQPICV